MTTHHLPAQADVVIVGAGIMGASLAYFLARKGVPSLVLDRSGPAAEASGANAGMIGRAGGLPGTTLPLSLLSATLYEEAAGTFPDTFNFHQHGRLRLALDAEEVTFLEAFVNERRALGLDLDMVYGTEVQTIEPILSDRVIAAAYIPDDGQIDPVRATEAYLNAACRLGARFQPGVDVSAIVVSSGAVRGVRVGTEQIRADRVVIAAGAWSASLAATAGVTIPVYPGPGQMLMTESVEPLTPRVLRALMIGMRQTDEGNLVIGSEVEPASFNKQVQPDTVARYLAFIGDLVPRARAARIERVWVGLRPMTGDGLPIIGAAPGVSGLDLLTGHGRSGMSYGPASGLALADLIISGKTDIPIEPLRPDRFQA